MGCELGSRIGELTSGAAGSGAADWRNTGSRTHAWWPGVHSFGGRVVEARAGWGGASGSDRRQSELNALLTDPQVRPEAMVIMSEFSAVPSGTGQGQQKPLRVGFYDVERTLGKGNFAVVKLARHRVTKTQVRARVGGD